MEGEPQQEPRLIWSAPPEVPPEEALRLKAECWYNLPEIVNDAVVLGAVWWWVHGGEWARSPLTLIALAFVVDFALRLFQLVRYSEVLNQIVFNTFGHNLWLWLIVIGEALWFMDQYKFFGLAGFLICYHLFGSNLVDIPGRILVDRFYKGDAKGAFERTLQARARGKNAPQP